MNILKLALILFFMTIIFQKGHSSELCLIVNGKITQANSKCEGAEIIAYDGNHVYWRSITGKNGGFLMHLPKKKKITMVIKKEGYITKSVIFDTTIEHQIFKPEKFKIKIDLVAESDLNGQDLELLDFPIAIIRYNTNSKSFRNDPIYTANIMANYSYSLNKAEIRNKSKEIKRYFNYKD